MTASVVSGTKKNHARIDCISSREGVGTGVLELLLTEYYRHRWLATSDDTIMATPPSTEIDDFLSVDNAGGGNLVHWYACVGGTRCQHEFIRLASKYPNVKHVCVLNQMVTHLVPDWNEFRLVPELLKMYKDRTIQVATIGELSVSPAVLDLLDRSISWEVIMLKSQSLFETQMLKEWFESSLLSLEATGYLLNA